MQKSHPTVPKSGTISLQNLKFYLVTIELMIVYGKQVFFHILKKHPEIIRSVYVAKRIDKAIIDAIRRSKVPLRYIDNKKAQQLSRGGNHQGLLLEIEDFAFTPFENVKDEHFLVILYGITDVGNIGSIVRTAYALGVDGVVVSGLKHLEMSGVIRRSSGAALDLPIVLETNLLKVIKELQDRNFHIYGATMDGKDIRKVQIASKKALLLGSEGEGLPRKALERCDTNVQVAMARDFDSLNVAAAGAILIDRMRDE